MKQELAEKIIEVAYETGRFSEEDIYIYEGYSGRGMYGDRTCGIVVDRITDLLKIVIENAGEFVDGNGWTLFESIGHLSMDSLGRNTIVY